MKTPIEIEVIKLSGTAIGDEASDVTHNSLPEGSSGLAQYQTLSVAQSLPWQPISPVQIADVELPQTLDLTREVVLDGRLPNWFFGRLIDLCHAAPWVGCYNGPVGGIVVVASRISALSVGDLVPVKLNRLPCPAIAIGGPPNSGKSVFSNALRNQLIRRLPHRKTYLHRASWDGEGDWAYEADTPMVKQFIQHNEYRLHESSDTVGLIPAYYQYHAKVVKNLRLLSDCVLVDMGGMPQPEKQPLLEQCTHYVVISRLAESIAQWHEQCRPMLESLAVINSVLEPVQRVERTLPILEITAGPWTDSASVNFPERVLDKCAAIYKVQMS